MKRRHVGTTLGFQAMSQRHLDAHGHSMIFSEKYCISTTNVTNRIRISAYPVLKV
jgi:hypothetical protein